MHESGCKSTGARNKSQHATGSENHTVNIMMNIILGQSFWLLHKPGWKPLAQFMQSSDTTSICKSKILDVAHLYWAEALNSKNASEFLQLLRGSIIISANVPVLQRHRGVSSLPL